jgi:hemerythrin
MRMFEWKTSYATQVASIDAQHQNLFAIGRELYQAMSAGKGKTVLARILDRMVQYTTVHFAHEERLMRLHEYPDLLAHKAEHDALTKQVLKIQEDFRSGQAVVTVQLLQFLRDWLDKHINGTDQKYAPLLKEKSAP